jgi:hypothetical protein
MMKNYRKPAAICDVLPEVELLAGPDEIARFAEVEKKAIEQGVAALGLKLRLANEHDIEAIQKFQASRFPPGTLLEDGYVLFRIVRFGYAPLIESAGGRIVACNLCEGYDDPERTLWGIRNSVDPSVSGANLAAVLANYSSLIGMQRGARFRRAFVSPANHASAVNLLNHVGFIAESLNLAVPGHHGPRFVLVIPLTPAGMRNNRIDREKLLAFMDANRAGRDYMTVPISNLEALGELYASTPFRVVAFLKSYKNLGEHAFFAVPECSLGLTGSR